MRVTHSSSTTGSPLARHSNSESPLPPHMLAAHSKQHLLLPGWGEEGMPGFPGVLEQGLQGSPGS